MKINLPIIAFIVLMIASCTKENSNEFVPYTGNELNDTSWAQVIPSTAPVRKIHPSLQRSFLSDSISAATGGVLRFNDSIAIIFPSNFCTTKSGAAVTDKIKIEILPLAKKGDMIALNKPSMNNDALLVSGGGLYIQATRNNEELKMAPNKKINVTIRNAFTTQNLSTNMKVFYGNEAAAINSFQNFTWLLPSPATSVITTNLQGGSSVYPAYGFFADSLRWLSSNYFFDTFQPKTKVTVSTPANFTNKNTLIYAVFKTENIVAYLSDDASKKIFFFNNAVIGKQITLVSLSRINEQLYLGMKEVTVSNNLNVSMQPAKVTKQDIETFLQSL